MTNETNADLAALPSVGRWVDGPELASEVAIFGRSVVLAAARLAIDEARVRILAKETGVRAGLADLRRHLHDLTTPSLRSVINATGVVLHTNLGRAPLSEDACQRVLDVARGYSTLELDLSTGERGSRQAHVASLLAQTLGADDAIAVNNNAAAVLLALSALAKNKEVIVARGELVEIGGGFRVPDVMAESGARLVEVGTTNKVYVGDYERVIRAETGAILVVHRSNFAIVGFASTPTITELSDLARRRGLPLLVDIGSGLCASPSELGPAAPNTFEEPRPKAALLNGADLVTFSGDKLLGGPQAGIIAGKRELVEKARAHPLARAVRIDKLSLAALESTLRSYCYGRTKEIPAVALLSATKEEIRAKAHSIAASIHDPERSPPVRIELQDGSSLAGGGSLPLARFDTVLVAVGEAGEYARRLQSLLRTTEPPVIARIEGDRLVLDPRSILPRDLVPLASAVRTALDRL
ncbi:MAG: L-seryl-tRNA(Sec) selenium transferase [Deltaproteobacteria bacterium]|nr:L-seryl-tRNA(Sec) selenium transferase [Deltaproteobacteria bacterium]